MFIFEQENLKNMESLSHQSIDDLHLGARIEVGEKKQDPLILLFGKQQNPVKYIGKVHGEKDDRVGILNAQQWRENI